MSLSKLENVFSQSFPACGDADAEPGARMTCRLLLHLFRAPQACVLPQATGELTAAKAQMSFSFGGVDAKMTKQAVHSVISFLIPVSLLCR